VKEYATSEFEALDMMRKASAGVAWA